MRCIKLASPLLGIMLLGLAAACDSAEPEPAAVEEYDTMGADQIILGLRQWLTTDGIRRAELTADTAFVYPDSSIVELRGVHVVMYDEQGRRTGELTSRTGEVNTRTESMVGRGDVVVISVEGTRRIETEELHYDPRQDRVWSDVTTTMIRDDGSRATGTSFRADSNFRNVELREASGQAPGVEFEF